MECPNCKLINSDNAIKCDCGYDFNTKSVEEACLQKNKYKSVTGDTNDPLYGVHGWLKFFIVIKLYIQPVIFGIQLIIAFIGFGMLADEYPGVIAIELIQAAVSVLFIIKWIMIARHLRDIVPGVIQETKKWMLISLVWAVLGAILTFMSAIELHDKDVAITAIKQLFGGVVGFAIWYSYFKVSKRVKATYPDWNM